MRSTAPLTYVTLRRDYSPGAFRQVEEMARVAAREHLPLECYWIRGAHSPHPKPPHVHVIDVENRLGGGIGLRLAQYKAVADLARERPHILLRYPTADPALLALMSQRRLITEHHSKEIEELELDQPGRAALERWLGASILRRTRGLVAVTRDILDYERARAGGRPGLVAGNAIDIHGDGPAWLQSPWRRHAPLRLLFVASTVHPWHGLDLVLDALARTDPKRYDLHVCGSAGPEYERQARAGGVTATFHGRLAADALWPQYEWADAGISAFGLHRKGLASASSLKVREYLLAGLPVVLQGADDAFPGGFPHVLSQPSFDLDAIASWLESRPRVTRADIRNDAAPYISMAARIRALVDFAASTS